MMVTANRWLPSLRTRVIESSRQTDGNKKERPITIVDGASRLTREMPFAWPSVLLNGR
jgi:hypothetical protein